jgi:hypothetical protein
MKKAVRREPDLRLTVTPDSLRWRPGLVLRGLESLPVAFGPTNRPNQTLQQAPAARQLSGT